MTIENTEDFKRIPTDEDPSTAKTPEESLLRHERQTQAQNIGRLGKIFGNKENAQGYLITILLLAFLILLAGLAYAEPSIRSDLAKGLFTLMASLIGYFGGKAGSKNGEASKP